MTLRHEPSTDMTVLAQAVLFFLSVVKPSSQSVKTIVLSDLPTERTFLKKEGNLLDSSLFGLSCLVLSFPPFTTKQ
jgi:hypothetical protein